MSVVDRMGHPNGPVAAGSLHRLSLESCHLVFLHRHRCPGVTPCEVEYEKADDIWRCGENFLIYSKS